MENVQKFEDYFEVDEKFRNSGIWTISQIRHDTDDFRFLLTYEAAMRIYDDVVNIYGEDIQDVFDYIIEEYGIKDFFAFCKREGYEERDGYEGYKTGEYDDSDEVIYYYIIERYPFEQWFKDYNDCVFSNIEFFPKEHWDEEYYEPNYLGQIYGPTHPKIIFDEELKKLL